MVLVLLLRPRGLLGERIQRFEDACASRPPNPRSRRGSPMTPVPRPSLLREIRPLLVVLACLVALPFLMDLVGLTMTTATDVVVFALAVMGLNILVGWTGLVSFGHGAWFGIGAYAAALLQRHFLPNDMLLPAIGAVIIVAAFSALAGALILRRRGVYFRC
ncbi:hypothetical protein ACFQU7_26635 [Pseudoroseomonas wenyumeiae]